MVMQEYPTVIGKLAVKGSDDNFGVLSPWT
jgi:hypothetical protein